MYHNTIATFIINAILLPYKILFYTRKRFLYGIKGFRDHLLLHSSNHATTQ